jgi:hypothetical protein
MSCLQHLALINTRAHTHTHQAQESVLIGLKIMKPLRLIRLLRLLKVMKNKMFKAIEQAFRINPNVLRLSKLLLGTLVIAHIFGCLFWIVKNWSNTPQEVRDWMDDFNVFKGKHWWCDLDKEPDCRLSDDMKVNVWTVYSTCVYFAMTTLCTVGYGDISATNEAEQVFCIFLQLAGSVVFAAIMSQLGAVIANITAHSRAIEMEQQHTRQFMEREHVSLNIANSCCDWIGFREDVILKSSQMENIIRKLPRDLQEQVSLQLYEELIQPLPIFYMCGSDFIAKLAANLTRYLFNTNELVIESGKWNDTLFMIRSGFLQVCDRGHNKLMFLDKGDCFGQSDVLRPRIQRTNVSCLSFSELLGISTETLEECARDFPCVQKRLNAMARQIDPRAINLTSVNSVRHANHAEDSDLEEKIKQWDHRREEKRETNILRWGAITERSLRLVASADKSLRLINRLVQFSHNTFGNVQDESSSDPDANADVPNVYDYEGRYLSEHEDRSSKVRFTRRGSLARQSVSEGKQRISPQQGGTESEGGEGWGERRVSIEPDVKSSEMASSAMNTPILTATNKPQGDTAHAKRGSNSIVLPMLDHAGEREDQVMKRISTVDRHIIKIDKRLFELQGAMDKVLWVLTKHRLDSVRTQRKMGRREEGTERQASPSELYSARSAQRSAPETEADFAAATDEILRQLQSPAHGGDLDAKRYRNQALTKRHVPLHGAPQARANAVRADELAGVSTGQDVLGYQYGKMSTFMGMGATIPSQCSPGYVTTPLSKRTSPPRTHGFGQNAPRKNSASRSPSRSFSRSQSTDARAARIRSKEEVHRYSPREAKSRVSSNHTESTRIPSAEIDSLSQKSYEMPNVYINGGAQRQRGKSNGTARQNNTLESLSQTTLTPKRGRETHTDTRRTRTGESHRASPSMSPDARPRTASAFSDIVLAQGKGVRTSPSQLTPVHVKLRSFREYSQPDSSINLGVGLVDYGSSPRILDGRKLPSQVASQGNSFPSMRRPPSSSRTGII